ncbi:hypothetical protein [Streptomyces erythrochromogenes]|uniref:hypothetical protein n=1 Tax=Streptomyces erythrochromogenes TaxID=285574 RepID=UPI00382B7A14
MAPPALRCRLASGRFSRTGHAYLRRGPGARGSTVLGLSGNGELGPARAVVPNVTATDPKSDGHLTFWPSGAAGPDSSNLNWTTGRTVAHLVTVPVGADGKVEIANLGWGSAHVVVDLFGHFG